MVPGDSQLHPARYLLWGVLAVLLILTGTARAEEVLLSDSFYLGSRPRGNNGNLRDAFPNTSLNDFWLQFPSNALTRWAAADAPDFGWQFSASSIDPLEPPEDAFGGNGTITARGNPDALVAFAPPATAFSVAANLLPLGDTDWVAIGFTSSGVLSSNFENFAQIWLRFWGNGDYEVRTMGTSGQLLNGHVTKIGFTPAKLVYDPVTRRISGFVNDQRFAAFTNDSVANIQFVGLEARTADPLFFAHANYFRVTRLSQPSADPVLTFEQHGAVVTVKWPTNADGCVLQQSSSLAPFATWTNLWTTNVVGGQFTVTNPPTNPAGYFRLREL